MKTLRALSHVVGLLGAAVCLHYAPAQAAVNVFDPDGSNSKWSPWLYVRQNCPFGGTADHFALTIFAIKYWQGGEETQIPTNVQASAYACKTS